MGPPIPCSALALDIGQRRIGLAGCDPLGLTVTPLVALQRGPFERDLAQLQLVIRRRAVQTLVLGLPLAADGQITAQARHCRRYGLRLAQALARSALGDRGAFKRVYDLSSGHLFAVILRIQRDRDQADDLLQAVEAELRRRRFGEAIRLEVADDMDPVLRGWLTEQLDLDEPDVFPIRGLIDLGDLWQLHGLRGYDDLRDPPWSPVSPPALRRREGEPVDIFAAMRRGDIIVHHPYLSFNASVERLSRQAARDPKVLAIKQTVYRTSDDSNLVPSLVEAAEQGKQAVSVVEVKARFDESENIGWVRTLEEAGAHVCHGLPGLKTHAKALMVVRREGKGGVRRYVHIGTGNYNAKTARIYEDFGLLTCDPDIAEDISDLFNMLTGYARPKEFRKVVISPHGTRTKLLEEIDATIAAHRNGERARITMKMNALVDRKSIAALYRASQAGVKIDLLIRGVCCLVPGVPGVSETIRVRSVVGRFLEHSRIYAFERGSERKIWIGSADLMPRNLESRVELLVPIEEPALQDELFDSMDMSLADDTYSWELGSDRVWRRLNGRTRCLHEELIARAIESSDQAPKRA